MTTGSITLLRSRRLALVLLTAIAALAIFGTLPLTDPGRERLALLPGLLATARVLGLVDTYRSPLFFLLVGALGLNIVLCTWHRIFLLRGAPAGVEGLRRRARRFLDAIVHLSLLAIVAGGISKGIFGFVRTRNIHVGQSADVFYDFRRGADVPLGFTLEVLEREDTYYPFQALIGVRDRSSGGKIDLLELREGRKVELPGGGLSLAVERLDVAGKMLRLRTVANGQIITVDLAYATGTEDSAANVGEFRIQLVAWKRELKGVRSRVACSENGARTHEGWISPQGRLTCKDVSFALTAYGVDDSGKPFVGLQAVRDPAAPLFWGGCVVFALALPLFQVVRTQDREHHSGQAARTGRRETA